MNPQVSIFDLDHTICRVNTSFHFGIYLYRKKVLPFYPMLYLLGCYICYKVGFISPLDLHRKACHYLFCGQSITKMRQLVGEFLDQEFIKLLNPAIFAKLKNAQKLGHYTTLLSNSPDFIVQDFAKRLHVDDWAATKYIISENQVIAGVAQEMEGAAKAQFVREFMHRLSIPKENITGYSDSIIDLEFLQGVGVPIAVNPDKQLKKIAITNGWQIL